MSPDHPPPRDRRYSDEEFRWILEQATREPGPTRSRAEEGVRSAPEGFSLDTIREIAREVGISEAAVDRAAASLEERVVVRSCDDAGNSGRTGAAGFRATFRVPRRLSEGEMRMLLLEAERILGRTGTREQTGDGIWWRDSDGRMQVEVARSGDSSRVRATMSIERRMRTNSILVGAVGLALTTAACLSWPVSAWLLGPLGLVITVATMAFYRLGARAALPEEIRGFLEELQRAVSVE